MGFISDMVYLLFLILILLLGFLLYLIKITQDETIESTSILIEEWSNGFISSIEAKRNAPRNAVGELI